MRYLFLAIPLALAACGQDSPPAPSGGMPAAPAVSADRAKDPVCHMMVDKSTPRKVTHEGATYYFCGDECLNKFKAEPKKYASVCSCGKSGQKCPCEHCGGHLSACDCVK